MQPITVLNAKNRITWLCLSIFCVFLFFAPPLLAAEELSPKPIFFESLYDVPVMDGLEEITGEAMLFDKPDGKIAFVAASTKTLTKSQIETFYEKTLPQMGWKKIKQNQYVRETEQLLIDVSIKNSVIIAQFTLSPIR